LSEEAKTTRLTSWTRQASNTFHAPCTLISNVSSGERRATPTIVCAARWKTASVPSIAAVTAPGRRALGPRLAWTVGIAAAAALAREPWMLGALALLAGLGFVAAGRVPVRKAANDLKGMAPAPGWLAKYDWTGFIPFAELPHAYNPADGQIVTANNRITPPGYAHFISSDWQPPYRAHRIAELLRALPTHSIGSFARIQGDVVSLPVRELLPRLLAVKASSEAGRRALQLLAGWDASMAADRAEPLILWAWWREFSRAIYADEMGEAFRGNWRARARFLTAVLEDRDGEGRWCDDVRTPAPESCDGVLAASLEAALADLRKRYGGDMAAWRWGAAHLALHEHRPFGRIRWLAGWFDIAVPSPGGPYTVNVGRNRMENEAHPFANTHAPSLRAIYDLSGLDNSLYIHSGGQSGNVFSPHYKAFTEAWARVEYIPMVTDRRKIEAGGVKRLRLMPK